MRLGLLLASFVGLASACIIDTTDDDDGNTSSNATSNGNNGSSGSNGSSTAAAGDTASSAADGTTSAGGSCGWGTTGQSEVPDGYVCGGDGADPGGVFAMGCPADVTLEVGAACGSIEGPGCCDEAGDVWYCGDAGSGPALARIEC